MFGVSSFSPSELGNRLPTRRRGRRQPAQSWSCSWAVVSLSPQTSLVDAQFLRGPLLPPASAQAFPLAFPPPFRKIDSPFSL